MLGFKKKKKLEKRVLVVEDDALLANVLISRLKKEGFETLGVENGLKVMDNVKTFNPDMILLDLILPGLDGFEVLKILKNDDKYKNIPVIVISNLDSVPDVKSVKALGAEEYFIKANIKMEEIIKSINKIIK